MKKSFLSAWGIFIGFVLGCFLGLLFHYFGDHPVYGPAIEFIVNNLFWPVGNVFLQALFMIIVPLVFSSLIVGISSMKQTASLGQLSKRLFLFYAFSTLIAIFIGQIFMGTMKPGKGFTEADVQQAAQEYSERMSSLKEESSMVGSSLWPGILTKVIPRNIISQFGKNNMLAVIFVSLLFGFSLLYLPSGGGAPKETFIQFMSALSDMSVLIIKWIMKTAPIAVMALIATSVNQLGPGAIEKMLFYILVMIFGMAVHFLGTYSLFLKFLIKIPIREFYLRMKKVFITAFATSSSAATMPVTMSTLEKSFGAPKEIVSFSIPIGVQVNMDGTALFEVAAALFIAQIFNVDLTMGSIAVLIALVFITSVGIAGIPGGSIPVLMSSIVVLGLPPEGVAMIIGVDRLLDMGRTVVNVTGDSIVTLYLSRKENVDINSYITKNPT